MCDSWNLLSTQNARNITGWSSFFRVHSQFHQSRAAASNATQRIGPDRTRIQQHMRQVCHLNDWSLSPEKVTPIHENSKCCAPAAKTAWCSNCFLRKSKHAFYLACSRQWRTWFALIVSWDLMALTHPSKKTKRGCSRLFAAREYITCMKWFELS